jgi:hypothetical protein
MSSLDDKTIERLERVLQTYYARLNNLDKSIRELTSFFFGINTAVLALVFRVVTNDLQRLILAFVGYCVSITIYLITYKSVLSWRLYAKDMDPLEDELDYDISKNYNAQLEQTPDKIGKTIRITLLRMRFHFLFIALWIFIIGYFAYTLATSWCLPPWLQIPLLILLTAAIIYIPWVYFAGTGRPMLIWATLRALWAKEV